MRDEQRERRVPQPLRRDLARARREEAAAELRPKERALPLQVAAAVDVAAAPEQRPRGARLLVHELELDPVDKLLVVVVENDLAGDVAVLVLVPDDTPLDPARRRALGEDAQLDGRHLGRAEASARRSGRDRDLRVEAPLHHEAVEAPAGVVAAVPVALVVVRVVLVEEAEEARVAVVAPREVLLEVRPVREGRDPEHLPLLRMVRILADVVLELDFRVARPPVAGFVQKHPPRRLVHFAVGGVAALVDEVVVREHALLLDDKVLGALERRHGLDVIVLRHGRRAIAAAHHAKLAR